MNQIQLAAPQLSSKVKTKKEYCTLYRAPFDNCFCRYFDHFLEQGKLQHAYPPVRSYNTGGSKKKHKEGKGEREGGRRGRGRGGGGGRRGREGGGELLPAFPPPVHTPPLPLSQDYTHAPLCVYHPSLVGVLCV